MESLFIPTYLKRAMDSGRRRAVAEDRKYNWFPGRDRNHSKNLYNQLIRLTIREGLPVPKPRPPRAAQASDDQSDERRRLSTIQCLEGGRHRGRFFKPKQGVIWKLTGQTDVRGGE
jgi:hypothetical protein